MSPLLEGSVLVSEVGKERVADAPRAMVMGAEEAGEMCMDMLVLRFPYLLGGEGKDGDGVPGMLIFSAGDAEAGDSGAGDAGAGDEDAVAVAAATDDSASMATRDPEADDGTRTGNVAES